MGKVGDLSHRNGQERKLYSNVITLRGPQAFKTPTGTLFTRTLMQHMHQECRCSQSRWDPWFQRMKFAIDENARCPVHWNCLAPEGKPQSFPVRSGRDDRVFFEILVFQPTCHVDASGM